MRQTKTQRSSIAAFLFVLLAISALVGQTPTQNPESARLLTQPKVKALPAKAKRWALVIGVDKYDDENITPLKGATNDANEIARALREYAGFDENQIIVLTNEQKAAKQPTRRNILKYLSNLKGLVPKDGLLLISFSGHGIERNGRAFLIPYDAAYTEDVSFLEETAISADQIKRDIKESGVSQVLILLDACRNDPAGGKADSINPLSDAYRRGFEFDVRNQEITAFATLYATSIGARAYEDVEKKEGYFTLAVVEALRGKAADPKTGEVTLQNLVSYIETNVPIRVAVNLGARKIQRPFAVIEGFRASELVLAVRPVEPDFGSTIGPADNEREAFVAIQNSTTVNEIRAVLEEYPTSRYAPDLRKRLERFVWESTKASHDKARLQAYLDEFGDKAQFASLARIEIRKLTASPTSPAVSSVSSPVVSAVWLANQALDEIINGNDAAAKRLADKALELDKRLALALAVRGWAKQELNLAGSFLESNELARKDLEAAAKLDPRNALFHARLIVVYNRLHKRSLSDKTAKDVLSLVVSPVTPVDYYARGIAQYATKHFDAAISEFTKAIELNASFTHAYYHRGFAHNSIGKYDSAIADFTKAIDSAPLRAYLYCNRGLAHANKKDYPSALGDYARAIELDPRYADAYRNRGNSFYDQKDYPAAIRDYTKAIELDPLEAMTYLDRGYAYSDQKDYQVALRDFSKGIKLEPRQAYLYKGRGDNYYRQKDYQAAIGDYTKAIELDPQFANAYAARGDVYEAQDDYPAAIRDYTKAIELDPQFANAYAARGDVYKAQKDYPAAIRDYTKAIELDPQIPNPYAARGNAYFSQKDYQTAIRDYTKAIELDPQFAYAFAGRGDVHKAQKDYPAAIRDYTKAIALNSQFAFAYAARGDVSFNQKDYQGAIRDYTKAIELNPQLVNVYAARGDAYYETKDYSAVIRDYTKVIELNPQSAVAYGSRGDVYYEVKDYPAAIRDYTKVIELNPQSDVAYGSRGDVYYEMKEYLAAIRDYTKTIELVNGNAETYNGRGRCYFDMKDYPSAIRDFTKAIEVATPPAHYYYYNRGLSYYNQGDYQVAIRDHTKAIELNPKYAYAYDIRAKAYTQIGRSDLAQADRQMYEKLK